METSLGLKVHVIQQSPLSLLSVNLSICFLLSSICYLDHLYSLFCGFQKSFFVTSASLESCCSMISLHVLWPTLSLWGYSFVSETQIFWFANFYEKQNMKTLPKLIAHPLYVCRGGHGGGEGWGGLGSAT